MLKSLICFLLLALYTQRGVLILWALESRCHLLSGEAIFFFKHCIWSDPGSKQLLPETRIQTHMDEASSDCDPAFWLFLSPSFPFPWHLSKCLLSLGSWWVWCCPDAFSGGSLNSQKAKLTSILHLVYLMPEEWVLKSPGGARRDLPPAEVWISPS